MLLLRSILFTALMFVSTVPWSLLVVAGRPFGAGVSYVLVKAWVRGVVWLARVLCGLDYRVEGAEHLPAEASVVLLKHSSAYETLVQLLIFPRQCWVLKRELLWAPFFGWGAASVNPIAIDRGAGRSAVDQVVRQGTQRLARGIWVMVFPEGTRMPAGQTRRYGISGTLLAQSAGAPIVPVAHDAGDYWPRRGLRKKPGTVRFVIGPPVDPRGREARAVNEEIQQWIETRVAELRAAHPQ